jgi:hypothetical protein
MTPASDPARPGRRTTALFRVVGRHPVLSGAALVLLVLAGVAVAADRIVSAQVHQRVIAVLQCVPGSQEKPGRTPEVRIDGPPVLLQLARGRFDTITVTGVPAAALGPGAMDPGTTALLSGSRIDLSLHRVRVTGPLAVGSAEMSTVLGWPVLQKAVGQNLGSGLAAELGSGLTLGAAGDQLAVGRPDGLLGRKVHLLADVSAGPGGLRVTPTEVQVDDRRIGTGLLGAVLSGWLTARAGTAAVVRLPLPEGVSLSSAQVRAQGLALTLQVDPDRLSSACTSGGAEHANT